MFKGFRASCVVTHNLPSVVTQGILQTWNPGGCSHARRNRGEVRTQQCSERNKKTKDEA